ncbi:FRAS1-related extracellular matrix protein 1 [Elysia marginata]|uniref:FRAS1-related extracellular matrix protein 1 n=1 Tax=Elysia marginata TaxID=1093978 RepID=A0AAV4EVJ8_9GAST|nr:FRAS1-related extracellular matrix protein 1 [Elysia marginata]
MASISGKTLSLSSKNSQKTPKTLMAFKSGLLATFLFVSIFSSTCQAVGLVVRHKDIRVDIGRSVYLARDDLVISSVRRGESCRVEVVMNDPATQRVGKLHPPVSPSLRVALLVFIRF